MSAAGGKRKTESFSADLPKLEGAGRVQKEHHECFRLARETASSFFFAGKRGEYCGKNHVCSSPPLPLSAGSERRDGRFVLSRVSSARETRQTRNRPSGNIFGTQLVLGLGNQCAFLSRRGTRIARTGGTDGFANICLPPRRLFFLSSWRLVSFRAYCVWLPSNPQIAVCWVDVLLSARLVVGKKLLKSNEADASLKIVLKHLASKTP